jgi:4-hydroxybenzoate polyprenyltransferase
VPRRIWNPKALSLAEAVLVDSGVGIALTAAVLLAAASHALGSRIGAGTLALVFLGSLGVYLIDRLRDLRRDCEAHPDRSRRIAAHSRGATATALGSIVGAVGLAWFEPRPVQLLLAFVFALALAHHWIKHIAWVKPLYIALSWWAVTVGVPFAHHAGRRADPPRAEDWATVLPLGLAIAANVLACDAADREAEANQFSPQSVWWVARVVAWSGGLIAIVVGGASAQLAPVPLCVAISLVLYRPTPRWTTTAVDGALLVGGVVALLAG